MTTANLIAAANRRLTPAETIAIVRAFLALPNEAIPSAQWDWDDYAGSEWRALRSAALRGEAAARDGIEKTAKMHLRADRDGWRDGVVVYIVHGC